MENENENYPGEQMAIFSQIQNTKSFLLFVTTEHGSFQSTSITDECQNVSIFFISEQKDAMCSLDRNGCSQL